MKKYVMLIALLLLSSLSFAKKLYVGTNGEFKPYEYLENGKLVGFDIELMNEIGKELGYEIVWNDMAFDALLPALQMKKIDAIIAGMSATEERKKAVAFSMPYILVPSNEHYVLVHEKSSLQKKEELKGKTVGVQLGTIQEDFAKNLGAKTKLYNSWTGALMDLQQKKIDAVIIADVTGKAYLESMKQLKKMDVLIDKQPGASIAVRKSEQKLAEDMSQAILKMDKNGKYLSILQKYFPEKVEAYLSKKKKSS